MIISRPLSIGWWKMKMIQRLITCPWYPPKEKLILQSQHCLQRK
uniref:Uncharacterized protein n=1 Tax=Picea sitchensis TaxID=3332 RepID=A9NKG8_PICSI|nr:unknown [Picea sitchensis]